MNGNQAELRLNIDKRLFVAVFGCRKKNCSLHHVKIRLSDQTATCTHSERAKAMATSQQPNPVNSGCSRPGNLREVS
jgi:hypothetical protein